MKIIIYSDLHLDFHHSWRLSPGIDGDILVLAGDIITFKDLTPLAALLRDWDKPVLFIAGNHEYYTRMPMQENAQRSGAGWRQNCHMLLFYAMNLLPLGRSLFWRHHVEQISTPAMRLPCVMLQRP